MGITESLPTASGGAPGHGGIYDRRVSGKNFITDQSISGVWLHETAHMWQHITLGTTAMQNQGIRDVTREIQTNISRYRLPGTLEYQAVWYEYYYSQQFGYPFARTWTPTVPAF
jgi:hypothetical protein